MRDLDAATRDVLKAKFVEQRDDAMRNKAWPQADHYSRLISILESIQESSR
jgi:hypothetical protein